MTTVARRAINQLSRVLSWLLGPLRLAFVSRRGIHQPPITTTARAPRVLFICGSLNQTRQLHQVATHMPGVDSYFSPYFVDGWMRVLRRLKSFDATIAGPTAVARCLDYLKEHDLALDFQGQAGPYDLVVTCSDLVIPRKIRKRPFVLVQEGMTDPEDWRFRLVRRLRFLPRWLAGTAASGLSGQYARFCVASEGYRNRFAARGAPSDRMVVTGMPNFDDCQAYRSVPFETSGYVLVCTSDSRETMLDPLEDRVAWLTKVRDEIVGGRKVLVKLHPNERVDRATREIAAVMPEATIYTTGNAEVMVAHCDVLVTQYSTLTYVGLALGKEVHSSFDLDELKRLLPLQNGGASARSIAQVCEELLARPAIPPASRPPGLKTGVVPSTHEPGRARDSRPKLPARATFSDRSSRPQRRTPDAEAHGETAVGDVL